ncbi:MAG: hypothetical protein JWP01_3786 [Myxococcales bacterium]|nr:hypothetical protein [Myxococcales bacterium]
MKLFSIKRLIGLAAVYGAVNYAKKNGGAKAAFEGLVGKAKEALNAANAKKDEVIGAAHSSGIGSSSPSYADETGFGSSSGGYGGGGYSSGFGGNGSTRRG